MPRWTHIAFGLIWLVTAYVFAQLAIDAHTEEATSVPRYSYNIPEGIDIAFAGVSLGKIIDGIEHTHNESVSTLEASIHRSARTSFVLNSVSAIFALVGFAAQIGEYLYERRSRTAPN